MAAALIAAAMLADAEAPAASARLEGRLAAALSEAGMEARLRLEASGGGDIAFSLAADDEGAIIAGGLSLEGWAAEADPPAAFLAAGAGRAAGSLRLLHDPLSYAALRLGEAPLALDPSLGSSTAVLGAGAPLPNGTRLRLSGFALAQGGEAGLLLRRGDGNEAASPRWAAAGLELAGSRAGNAAAAGSGESWLWSALAAVSLRRASAGGGGWEPDPPPDAEGLYVSGCLLGESRGASGRSLAALAGSVGARGEPALAARVEAEERAGPLGILVSAALAGRAFRTISASRAERGLALACDLSLALARAAKALLALRLESPRLDAGARPLMGSSARLGAELPLAALRRMLAPRLDVSRKPGGLPRCELGLALGGGRRSGGDLDLSLDLAGEDGSFGGLGAEYRARSGAFGLEWELDLALSCLEGGEPGSPVVCGLSFSVGAGLGEDSKESLRLEASSPGGGFILAPLAAGEPAPRFELELRYQASF